MSRKLKVGDLVSFGEQKGIVTSLNSGNPLRPTQIFFPEKKTIVGFSAAGTFEVFNEKTNELMFTLPVTFLKRPRMKLGVFIKLKVLAALRRIFGIKKPEPAQQLLLEGPKEENKDATTG